MQALRSVKTFSTMSSSNCDESDQYYQSCADPETNCIKKSSGLSHLDLLSDCDYQTARDPLEELEVNSLVDDSNFGHKQENWNKSPFFIQKQSEEDYCSEAEEELQRERDRNIEALSAVKYLFGEEAPEPDQLEGAIPSVLGDYEDIYDHMTVSGRHQFDNLSVVSFDARSEAPALYHIAPDNESELLETPDVPIPDEKKDKEVRFLSSYSLKMLEQMNGQTPIPPTKSVCETSSVFQPDLDIIYEDVQKEIPSITHPTHPVDYESRSEASSVLTGPSSRSAQSKLSQIKQVEISQELAKKKKSRKYPMPGKKSRKRRRKKYARGNNGRFAKKETVTEKPDCSIEDTSK